MSFEVSIRLDDNSQKLLQMFRDKVSVILEKLGLAGEGFAKIEITKSVYDTPERGYKRTGNLRNSLTHTVKGDATYIGTNVEYAAYVELGTSRTRARPYLKPAITEYKDQYKQIAESELKE